ncbi:hypothetical protein BDR07DRAFT_1433136, partial [Suillus spraguei]
ITSLDFSPDSTIIASGSKDNTTQFWNTKTWEVQGYSINCGNQVYCVRYSPHKEHIAQFKGHSNGSWNYSLAWTPDGKQLVSSGDFMIPPYGSGIHRPGSRSVRIWRLSDRQTIAIFTCTNPVYCVTFSMDGEDQMISKWAVPSSEGILNDQPSACVTGTHPKEQVLLTKEIGDDSNDYNSYANRSFVMARKADWDHALDDALKGMSIQPSLMGCISKGIALCGKRQFRNAMKAFDLGFLFVDQIQENPSPTLDQGTKARCLDWSTAFKRDCRHTAGGDDALAAGNYDRAIELYSRKARSGKMLWDDALIDAEKRWHITKLQSFCKTARAAGYRWGWMDSCCIDQANNVELQKSLNSMFAWYRTSALTMVYLSDERWNTRGWTVPEFLAPKVIRFYQSDWTPYLDDHSPNHKQSAAIMQELEDATGMMHRPLCFRPGMIKLEDIAYSLFGIFANGLGRLLQEMLRSGDITALDWVGTSSEFNSCLPAQSLIRNPPYMPPPISEDEIQRSLARRLRAPRFDHRRLHLPCIVFPVTEIRRRSTEHKESYFTYAVKADGLCDLQITTEDKLSQFTRGRPARQSFLLVRPWDRRLFELPDHGDDAESVDDDDDDFSLPESSGEQDHNSGEHKRIASDHDIITQVQEVDSVHGMMDVRTLEIL